MEEKQPTNQAARPVMGGKAGDGFKADLDDSRFKAIYSDPRFALDPTDPDYQRTSGAADLAKEVASRRRAAASTPSAVTATAPAETGDSGAVPASRGLDAGDSVASMRSMVANLKRKADKTNGQPMDRKLKKKMKKEKVSGRLKSD
eukprot:scaffold522523_cov46-Prasinocladus_malaysianus.AAC.1